MSEIPKVIHYCWFGKSQKSKLIQSCIESWKANLPDYKLIQWNEDNFDIECNEFVRRAYQEKKYAFVSDYCRIRVLHEYGGIYLDTDMEIIRNIDTFLNNEAFLGKNGDDEISGAIWGCKMNDTFLEKVLEYYDDLNFDDYINDLSKIEIPKIITKLAIEEGFKNTEFIEKMNYNTVIYPKDFFYPKLYFWDKPNITNLTFTIHHYEGSWKNKNNIYISKVKKVLRFIIRLKYIDIFLISVKKVFGLI